MCWCDGAAGGGSRASAPLISVSITAHPAPAHHLLHPSPPQGLPWEDTVGKQMRRGGRVQRARHTGLKCPCLPPFPQVCGKGKVNPLPGPPPRSTWVSHSVFGGSQRKTPLSSVFYTPLEEPSQEGISFSHYRETQAGCTHRLQISHLFPSSSSYTSSSGLKANLGTEKGKNPQSPPGEDTVMAPQ